MQPIIGVTTSLSKDEGIHHMNLAYPGAVRAAGGLPVMIPATLDAADIARYAALVDGLLLSGGDDLDPARYGAHQQWACGTISPLRDGFELALCREVLRLGKPILGICRGIQVLNVAMGGTLYQDLPSEAPQSHAHRQHQRPEYASHSVAVTEGSLLHRVVGTEMLAVNSLHHQAVRDVADGLIVTAVAPDGVIEAVEHTRLPFCLGVQWHPERLWDRPETAQHACIFKAFVEACGTCGTKDQILPDAEDPV